MSNCCICGKKLGMFEGSSISWEKELSSFIVCGSCSAYIREIKDGSIEGFRKIKPYIENVSTQDLKKYLLDISQSFIEQEKNEYEHLKMRQAVKVTTGYNFEGYKIKDYRNVISGECVLGTGFLSEVSAAFSDFTGTKDDEFSTKLREAKNVAMISIKDACLSEDGNAIIGVDFDYITFASNMIGVVANGTAVVIEKI